MTKAWCPLPHPLPTVMKLGGEFWSKTIPRDCASCKHTKSFPQILVFFTVLWIQNSEKTLETRRGFFGLFFPYVPNLFQMFFSLENSQSQLTIFMWYTSPWVQRLFAKRKTEHGSEPWSEKEGGIRGHLNRKGDMASGESRNWGFNRTVASGILGCLLPALELASQCPKPISYSIYPQGRIEWEGASTCISPLPFTTWSPGQCSSPVTAIGTLALSLDSPNFLLK